MFCIILYKFAITVSRKKQVELVEYHLNTMCNFDILQKDQHGFVVKCKSCNKIRWCFGNLVVNCDENEFQQLVTAVETETRKHIKSDTDTGRNIFLEHPAGSFNLVFNSREIRNFNRLLQESYITNEIGKLLQ